MNIQQIKQHTLMVMLSASLFACGGGSSGGGNVPPTPPVTNASLQYYADSGYTQKIPNTTLNSSLNSSATKTIYVKNTSNTATGIPSGKFTKTITTLSVQNNTCNHVIIAGGTCNFILSYTPTSTESGSVDYNLSATNTSSSTLTISYGTTSKTSTPYVLGYYANYSGYFNNNTVMPNNPESAGHAIAEPSYVIPGVDFGYQAIFNDTPSTIQNKTNSDLQQKIDGLDGLVYSFFNIEIHGAIHFSDAWADLGKIDYSHIEPKTQQLYDEPLGKYMINVPGQLPDAVNFNGFGAFMNLTKSNGALDKFISIGGWQGVNWAQNLNTPQQIAIFVASLQQLRSVYNFDGLDLDVEDYTTMADGSPAFTTPTQFYTYLNTQIVQVVNALNTALPDLKISLTLQADPNIINAFGTNLNQLQNKLFALNLMTYDFHGAFDAKSITGGFAGKTGLNSNLFVQDGDTVSNDFSVDGIVSVASNYIASNKINIGLPAYGRAAINNVGSSNYGLFQPFSSANGSIVLPGDLDNSYCTYNLGDATICSGTFDYNYIISKMLGNGFTEKNWQQNGYSNATTAFAPSWTVLSGLSMEGIDSVGIATNYPNKTPKNVYISYVSGVVAHDYGRYATTHGLKGAILWTVMGDAPYSDSKNSLIYNFRQGMLGN